MRGTGSPAGSEREQQVATAHLPEYAVWSSATDIHKYYDPEGTLLCLDLPKPHKPGLSKL